MSDFAQIIGRNIEQLRESRGMSKKDLADLLGVTRQTLDNYLKGRQIIDSGKLALLAREFSKSMDFFLSATADRGASLLYRAERAADTPAEVIDLIIRRFELYAELLEVIQLKSVFHPPTYTVKLEGPVSLSESDQRMIEEIAGKTRRALGLDGVTGQDLFLALEDAGINILAFPTDPQAEVWAASAYSEESGAYIYVNDDGSISEERKIFSLIHELGHLVLHRHRYSYDNVELKYVSRRKDIYEKVADHFASSFLLPRHRLEQDVERLGDISPNSIFYLKQKYKVSFQAMVMALHNYQLISDHQRGRFFAFLNAGGYSKAEPHPLPYFEKGTRYRLLVQKLYQDGEIGVNKVAEYLDLPISEARRVVREWGV